MARTVKKFQVLNKLPEQLKPLVDIAYNLWWCWHYEAIELFQSMDIDQWSASNHSPVKMLSFLSQKRLQELSEDEGFLNKVNSVHQNLQRYLKAATWYNKNHGSDNGHLYAYFSAEFGIHESLPNYSGGLGVLAGDHLKSASDTGLPLVGVGLLYRRGYFRQYMNEDGWQQEDYPYFDFHHLPVQFVTDKNHKQIKIDIDFPGRKVFARVGQVKVGRVNLFLLDTDISENSDEDRSITDILYGGDTEHRIKQELVLGIGGVRALKSMGMFPTVVHMNEGHSAFSALERIRSYIQEDKLSFDEARELVKGSTVFTTHTPVPAGNEVFPDSLIAAYLEPYLSAFNYPLDQFLDMGRIHLHQENENFGMTVFSLRSCAAANGVSRLHGRVAREMWHAIWENLEPDEAPIGYVTNGIHLPSWISDEMERLYSRYISPDWAAKADDVAVWEKVDNIPTIELWKARQRLRARLVSYVRSYLKEVLQRERHSPHKIASAANLLDSDILTIGFARRFATYKRANLLLKDKDRLLKLLTNKEMPVQFVFAGKAHPRDMEGKKLIKEIIHFARENNVSERFVFLENYDIRMARYLVQGVDIWLNNPRRPHEASGTSGMKVPANGGLNLSILDGWWAEAYEPGNGWAIGGGEEYHDYEYQDYVESRALYDLLESEVVHTFYERGVDGLPLRWIEMIRNSMRDCVPVFHTDRMVKQYAENYYVPVSKNYLQLSNSAFTGLKDFAIWRKQIQSKFNEVKVESFEHIAEESSVFIGQKLKVVARVNIGNFSPADIEVMLVLRPVVNDKSAEYIREVKLAFVTKQESVAEYAVEIPAESSGQYRYSVRANPSHDLMYRKLEPGLVTWG